MNNIENIKIATPNLNKSNEAGYSSSTYAKFMHLEDTNYWWGYNGSDLNHSNRMILLKDDNELAEFNKYDVDIEEYTLFRDSMKTLDELTCLFPTGNLQNGIKMAIKAKCTDLLAAAHESRQNPDYAFSIEEIHIVQHDVTTLLEVISMSLGSDVNEKGDAYKRVIHQKRGERFKNDGYLSSYDIESKPINPEDASYWEKLKQKYHNLTLDRGSLEIKIIPDVRISFDYKPSSESISGDYYKSNSVIDGGEIQMQHHNDALCMRIDLDDNAPYGIALDLGRSPFSGTRIQRDGDLIGRIFSSVSKNGCHEHTGFTPQMKDEFGSFAEELALKQHLYWTTQQQGAQKSA